MNVPEFVHLNDVKHERDDLYADVWLRREQINERQTVSFRHPGGWDCQLNLTGHVREGTILRLAGKGVGNRGQLVLHVRLIDF